MTTFDNNYDENEKKRFWLKFINLTKYVNDTKNDSLSVNNLIDDLFTEDTLNKNRLEFYKEYMKNIDNPENIKSLYDIYNKIKKELKYENELKKKFFGLLNQYMTMTRSTKHDIIKKLNNGEQSGGQGSEDLKKNISDINHKLQKGEYFKSEDDIRAFLASKYKIKNLSKLNQNILNFDNDERFENKKNSIQQFIDDYYLAHNKGTKREIADTLSIAVNKLENAPDNALESLKISNEDRLIFISVSFFIRYVSIMLIQWSIDINIIKEFYQGFLLYAVVYAALFWFIVMFVNINTGSKYSYMDTNDGSGVIKSIFYYFYMGTNGITHLLTHTFLIIILLVVPILLNIHDKKENPEDFLTYSEKRKLIKTLSLFTIFIWILTSIVATKF
jgi:hypothetical protein